MKTNEYQRLIIHEFVKRDFKVRVFKEDGQVVYMTNEEGMKVEIHPDKYMVYNSKYKNIFTEKRTLPGETRYWKKKRYDKNGNMIHVETSYGDWDDYSYDSDNQLIKHTSSSGIWEEYSYASNGRQCFYNNSDGFWERCEFDSHNRIVHKYSSDNHWRYSFPDMGIDIEGIKNKFTKIRINKEAYNLNKSRYNNYHALLDTGLLAEKLSNKTFSKIELYLYEKLSEVMRIEEYKEDNRQKLLLEEKKRRKSQLMG